MDGETVGDRAHNRRQRAQQVGCDPGLDGRGVDRQRLRRGQLGRREGGFAPHLVEYRLEFGVEVVEGRLGLLERDVAPPHQRLGVELAHRALGFDALVHEWLGVARVVALVVPVLAVADEIDDHVLVEGLAEGEGESGGANARLGVVSVDVEDGRLDHLGHVSRVHRRAGRRRAPS